MTPLDSSKASFRTHLNYIKCIERLFSSCELTATRVGTVKRIDNEISRFRKLYKVTLKSIKKDIEFAREDSEFAVIVAPWFPVKCYYSLYYLESILVHLINGSNAGFAKGGHTQIRRQIYDLVAHNFIIFSQPELNSLYLLKDISNLPSIRSGQNTCHDFWQKKECLDSVAKKLLDYKLHDKIIEKNWDLRRKKHRDEKEQYINKKQLMLIDFFYWYRIKANYRDLDYIDFEGGIDFIEVLEYLETYYRAFDFYRSCLAKQVGLLLK